MRGTVPCAASPAEKTAASEPVGCSRSTFSRQFCNESERHPSRPHTRALAVLKRCLVRDRESLSSASQDRGLDFLFKDDHDVTWEGATPRSCCSASANW